MDNRKRKNSIAGSKKEEKLDPTSKAIHYQLQKDEIDTFKEWFISYDKGNKGEVEHYKVPNILSCIILNSLRISNRSRKISKTERFF